MQFLPEDIENIIIDYKKQFERTYTCGFKHADDLFESRKKTGIVFYKHPYKFECCVCNMKICDEHSDEYVKQHTKDGMCSTCYLTNVKLQRILKNIEYSKDELEDNILSFGSILFFFKDENLDEVNEYLHIRLEECGGINSDDIYEGINGTYSRLQFFDFFEDEI